MFGKAINRYIAWSFLFPFFGCLILVFGLYSSFDMLKRIDALQALGMGAGLRTLLSYYGYMFPVFAIDTVPAMVLVAAGMALVRMSKQSELLVLKASGVSVYQMTLPIFLCTLLITLACVALRETVVPQFARKGEVTDRRLGDKTERSLFVEDREQNFKLFVRKYDFENNTMQQVCVMVLYPSGKIKVSIEADQAAWAGPGVIRLKAIQMRQFDLKGKLSARPSARTSMDLQTSLRPFDFSQAKKERMSARSTYLSMSQLLVRTRGNPGIPNYRVMFHSRLASTVSPFLLLLVGIPLLVGFEHSSHSRFLGVIVCILVAAGYYVVTFVFGSMGNAGTLSPVLAGWLPVVMIGAAGLWMFEAMLT